MTLIMNEIHILDGLEKSVLVFAADRQITIKGKYDSSRKKLFKIAYLDAGVSYFGLAQVFPKGKTVYMSDWLPDFIKKQNSCTDLETFTNRLKSALNEIVPPKILMQNPSGFHLAGYNSQGYPDFFHFSNIGGNENFQYFNLQPKYGEPSSHFLGRDALEQGWNGIDPKSINNHVRIYRNGDIRAHESAWLKLDEIFAWIFQFPDFKRPSTIKDYQAYVKTKLEMIAYIYKKFARQQIVARPIDIFCLHRL